MVCIYCHSKTEIINSRHLNKSNYTWRRRRCLQCKSVVTSLEEIDLSKVWVVKNRFSKIEPFSRDKLFLSLYNSLGHRKTALNDASAITTTIISKISEKSSSGLIEFNDISETVLNILSKFDKSAATYYRAYHS
jgi:transcriptional regulator NrdR family protein